MNLKVAGKQIDISKPFRAHVEEKLTTLNDKYSVDPVDVNVTINHENHDFHCEVAAHLGKGMYLRGNAEGGDAYSCFDNTLEVLEKRLRRHKKRLNDHNRKRDIHVKQEVAPSYVLGLKDEPENHESKDLAPPIIAETKKEIQTLSVGEAVFRMDMGNENPYIFRNSSHGRINVVYHREDGNIGWVDIPQE